MLSRARTAMPLLFVLGVILLGFWIRAQMIQDTEVIVPIRADAAEYYLYALNLKRCGVYSRSRAALEGTCEDLPEPDALRPPGYPLLLLPFVHYPPDEAMLQGILWTQALLGALTIWLSYSLFRGFLPRWGAGLGSLLVALSPHLVTAGIYVLSETLFTLFLVGFAWLAGRLARTPTTGWALAAGLVLGVTALVRPTMVYFVVVFLPFVLLSLGGRRGPLGAAVLIGFLAAYGPWAARNALTVPDHGRPSLATITVHLGMYPGLTYQDNPETYGFPNHADPSWRARDTVGEVLGEIGRRFSQEPGRYLYWYLAGKPVMLLSWDMVQGQGDVFIYPVRTSGYQRNDLLRASHRVMEWLHWPLTALALAGALLVWLPSTGQRLAPGPLFTARALSLILAYFLAVHMAGAPLPRYAIPLRPILFGLALFPLALLLRRPGERGGPAREPGADTPGPARGARSPD